jgi:hypothetical protein
MKLKNVFLNKLTSIHFKSEISIIFLDTIDNNSQIKLNELFKYSLFSKNRTIISVDFFRLRINIFENILKCGINKRIYQIDKCITVNKVYGKTKFYNRFIRIIVIDKNNTIKSHFIHQGKYNIHVSNRNTNYLDFLINNRIFKEALKLLKLSKNAQDSNNKCIIEENIDLFNIMYKNIIDDHKEHLMSIIYDYRYIKGTNGQKELIPIETVINKKLICNQIILLFDYFNININYFNSLEYYLNYKIKKKKTKYEKTMYYIFKQHTRSYFNLLNDDLKRIICYYL